IGVPTISVGSVGLSGEFVAAFMGEGSQPASIDGVLKRLEDKEFDVIAVGRALLNDPEWVDKIKDGRLDELKSFERRDLMTLY
ncbi:MAG: NADH:flavin oxidoreductase/NADH oxidase, partial [Hyphomonadaceae bacterium]